MSTLQWEHLGQLVFLCAVPFLFLASMLVTVFGLGAFCNWLDHRHLAAASTRELPIPMAPEPVLMDPQPQPQLLRG
jgi:hypothetical protein